MEEKYYNKFIDILFFCFIKSLGKSGLLVDFLKDHKERHNMVQISLFSLENFTFPNEVYNNNKLFYDFYKKQVIKNFCSILTSTKIEKCIDLDFAICLTYGAQISFPWHLGDDGQYNDKRYFNASSIMVELLSKILPPVQPNQTFKNWLKTI